MPDNPSVSCCNAADCYPTKIKYVNGDIYAKQRGITVLVLLSVVLTVAYFTASKRAIRHLRPRYPARSLGSRPRKNRQSFNLLVGHCQFDYSPPSCHDPAPRFANRKTRNPPSNHQFHDAGFMESIV